MGKKRGRAQEESGRGEISRHRRFDPVEALAAGDLNEILSSLKLRAKGAQGEFSMVARAHCLADGGRAPRLQAGKEDGGLHLRAGNRRWRRRFPGVELREW